MRVRHETNSNCLYDEQASGKRESYEYGTKTYSFRHWRNNYRQWVIVGRDLTGKIVVITSGQSGIGLETTRVLASAGALMVIGARDVKKATAAVAQINLGHFRLTAGLWSDT